MRGITYRLVLGCLISISLHSTWMKAQTCDECPTVPWSSPPGTVTIQIAEDCIVQIMYARKSCMGVDEVRVLGFNAMGPCSNMDRADQLNKALGLAVMNNLFQLGLPPEANTTQFRTWRIRKPACIASEPDSGASCDATNCCVHELAVRRLPNCPDWTISAEVQRDPNGGCRQQGSDESLPCEFTCRGALLPTTPTTPHPYSKD